MVILSKGNIIWRDVRGKGVRLVKIPLHLRYFHDIM